MEDFLRNEPHEALWADLSKNEGEFKSPAWHGEVLRETERSIAEGKAKFSDWDSEAPY